MTRRMLIGLDIGTSGAKCLLADETGRVIASATREYPLSTPRPGWAEQNPEDWWRGAADGIRAVLAKAGADAKDICGVSFSGQMHGLVALDAEMRVIRPAILWCDQRTQKQCDWITGRAGGVEGLLRYTNNRMLTGYTGGKLLWLRDEEPENFARMKIFCCPKDYIRFRLTGRVLTDVSEASGTGFFDTKNRVWADGLIALAGLDKAIFPKAVESTALAGCVTAEAAAETGLPEGLNVYAGGGDAVIQTTGTGLVEPGVLGVVIGTSGNVSMGMSGFHANPEGNLQMFCNNEPGLWHAFGCTLTAGGAFSWFVKTLAGEDAADAAALLDHTLHCERYALMKVLAGYERDREGLSRLLASFRARSAAALAKGELSALQCGVIVDIIEEAQFRVSQNVGVPLLSAVAAARLVQSASR